VCPCTDRPHSPGARAGSRAASAPDEVQVDLYFFQDGREAEQGSRRTPECTGRSAGVATGQIAAHVAAVVSAASALAQQARCARGRFCHWDMHHQRRVAHMAVVR
jgi:hypothetical protein